MLLESKSILAKLMATENLHIEQRSVSTASFNTKTRVLTVPILNKDIKPWTYDLFMGHEVGHALWTSLDDMTKANDQKVNKTVCNIVEDSRIERKIKDKYPGLRNSFSKAYKELYEDNFFGTKGLNLNQMNFIDRINLYCKIGVITGIKFSPEESLLVKEVENTQTFDDVIVVAKKIQQFIKEQEQNRKKYEPDENEKESEEYDFDSNGDYDDDDYDDNENSEDSTTSSDPTDPGKNENDEQNEESGNGYGGGDVNNTDDFDINSHTDKNYQENEKKLFAENAIERVYANVPKVDTKSVIMDHKVVYKKWMDEIGSDIPDGIKSDDYMKLRSSTSKAVSYLVKEFELRKNAEQLKRASVAKTGELNLNKIFSYSISEDIFKKITVVPGGKSHGLVMFLDWSGSMSEHIQNTVKQLISLVLFCKKVNIPYEVYAFAQPENTNSDGTKNIYEHDSKINELCLCKFRLLNLLSSRMTAAEFTKAACILVSYIGVPHSSFRPGFMSMSGTPLNEAIISAMEIVPEFQKKYRLQVVNTVFLTDGEGHPLREIIVSDSEGKPTVDYIRNSYFTRKNRDLVICDPVTREQIKVDKMDIVESHTKAYLQLFKKRTNSNVVGFYVTSGREFNKKISTLYEGISFDAKDEIKHQFRKNKYLVIENSGYDEYYVLRSENLNTEEETELEVKENATIRGLVSAFSKYTNGRMNTRVILNKFIGIIA